MTMRLEVEIFDEGPVDYGALDGPCPDPGLLILEDEIRRVYREFGEDVRVSRHWLGTDPTNYRDFPRVGALLRERGPGVLPVILVNGRVIRTGAYPSYGELEPARVLEDEFATY